MAPPLCSLFPLFVLLLVSLFASSLAQQYKCSNVNPSSSSRTVSQYGITFTFDKAYTVGQFANGDFWVLGPVRINSITPAYTNLTGVTNVTTQGERNGWEINSNATLRNGLDGRLDRFSNTILPSLPITVSGVSSIVKCISRNIYSPLSGNSPALQVCMVLTVLASALPNDGMYHFRPAYFGSDLDFKASTMLPTSQIQWNKFPKIVPNVTEPKTPALFDVAQNFEKVWIDHQSTWISTRFHPVDNMPNYGSNVVTMLAEGSLRLLLNDVMPTNSNATCAVIRYLQNGIDIWGMVKGGMSWSANGGHMNGRKMPVLFAGVFLGHQPIFDAVTAAMKANNRTFSEDDELVRGVGGRVLFGMPCTAAAYWSAVSTKEGNKACRDPYGLIDGTPTAGAFYQYCCTSMGWKSMLVTLNFVPEIELYWGDPIMREYVQRWVTHGIWSAPDDCAYDGVEANLGVTYGHVNGSCIKGAGRFIQLHGTEKDEGDYESPFANSLYAQSQQYVSPTIGPTSVGPSSTGPTSTGTSGGPSSTGTSAGPTSGGPSSTGTSAGPSSGPTTGSTPPGESDAGKITITIFIICLVLVMLGL